MMYQPSEVVLLPFPFTDLSASKKRPVLILKKPNFQGDFLAVQITSQSGYENALVLHQDDFILGFLVFMLCKTRRYRTVNAALLQF